jgi:P-type E1-E2 ATPase
MSGINMLIIKNTQKMFNMPPIESPSTISLHFHPVLLIHSGFKPFDPVAKHTEATMKGADGALFGVAKGAPQAIFALVEDQDAIRSNLEERVDAFAAKGYRALGVARTDANGNWRFAGLIPLYDPPREDSAETIMTAQSMGVDVKMVTGDHVVIDRETAEQVNLGTNIIFEHGCSEERIFKELSRR